MRALTKKESLAAAICVLTLGSAIVAGFSFGDSTNVVVNRIIGFSSAASGTLDGLSNLLGVSFGFAAGMMATVNPCGFVMLPVYLSLYVSDQNSNSEISWTRRFTKSLYVSAAVSLGFVLLFGITGFAISAGLRSLGDIFPWVGFTIGIVASIIGAYLLSGRTIYTSVATRAAAKLGNPMDTNLKGYFLFGLSYAIASLSCTLPIFLALVTTSLATGGLISATAQFLSYALGMAFVITALTITLALFKVTVVLMLRRAIPRIEPLSACLLILVGGYLVLYWLSEGGLAAKIR